MHVEHVMGTVVSFDVRNCRRGDAVEAVAAAVEWLHEVDAVFSTYRADSAVCRIDRGELSVGQAGGDVGWVLARCEQLRRATGGYFDVRATGRLDPSALVKGWSVQRAADRMAARGLTDFCLSAGGDVVCRGGREPGGTWRIGIQHPEDRAALAAVLDTRDLAVATSGAYERGAHIIDPHTRRSPGAVLSATVCGPDLGTADAYSTAAFAMGRAAVSWVLGLHPYQVMIVLADGTVYTTGGLPLAGTHRDRS